MTRRGEGKGPAEAHPAGLCGSCRHARIVENRKGSRFWLCRLSTRDPRFPRYPRLPVRTCAGFEAAGSGDVDAVEPGEEES